MARVKRAEALVIPDPHTIESRARLADALERMERHGVSGLVVVDAEDRLAGMLTRRDVLLQTDPLTPVAELMTPRARLVEGGPGTTSD